MSKVKDMRTMPSSYGNWFFLATFRKVLPLVLFDLLVLGGLALWNSALYNSLLVNNLNDFGKFYYSSAAFLEGDDMYGSTIATAARDSKLDGQHFWNMNPPHFHILLLPLVLLSPRPALTIWSLASLLCLVISLRLIIKELHLNLTPWQWRLGLAVLLSFSGTAGVLVTGQLSFLLLLPVTLAWIHARRGNWTTAGIYIGLAMSVKLFLLIFLPYLLLRRELRAVIAACVLFFLCFFTGLLAFGTDAHASWYRAITSVNWTWASGNGSILGILTRALGESPYYAPLFVAPGLIRPVWLAAIGLVACLTFMAAGSDVTKSALDRSFALVLLASQLISPLGWIYYLWLPLGPLVALLVSWWSSGDQGRRLELRYWTRLRSILLLAAAPGLVWPLFLLYLFQPQPWATVSVGSIYFWATFMLWLSLLADWRSVRISSPSPSY